MDELEKIAAALKAVETNRSTKSAKRRKKVEEASKKRKPAKKTPNNQKTYERIISKGKILERAILYLRNFDSENLTGKGILTADQKSRLREKFHTERSEEVLAEVGELYDSIFNYTRYYLLTAQKLWQSKATILLTLCERWEAADQLAETVTKIYYTRILPLTAHQGEGAYSEDAFKKYVSEVWCIDPKQGITPRVEQSGIDEEGRTLFKVVADVDGEEGLYSEMMEVKSSAEDFLRLLRGAVDPLSAFLMSEIPLQTGGTICPYTTILSSATKSILESPGKISFFESDPKVEKYFAYNLRHRREAGETITPEEEKRAVIPDYNQAEETEEYINSAKKNLYRYFPDYYDMNKDYGEKG